MRTRAHCIEIKRQPLVLGVAAISILSASCNPGRKFYIVEEIRVPAMQVLQKVENPASGQHCFDLSGEKVCQQYPLRHASQSYFRMLALAPATSQPMSIKFTKLQRAQLVQLPNAEDLRNVVTQIQSDPNATEESCLAKLKENAPLTVFIDTPLESLGLSEGAARATVKQESPLRIEEHVAGFVTPERAVLDAQLIATGQLPLYKIEYTATSGDLRADKGALTFAVVSEPQQGESVFSKCLARFFLGNASASTNIAPYITALTPARDSLVDNSPLQLKLDLAGLETDSNSKQRVQWYISRGELENEKAASTELSFSGSEPLTAVGIVRDLQGGVDFAWSTFSAKP